MTDEGRGRSPPERTIPFFQPPVAVPALATEVTFPVVAPDRHGLGRGRLGAALHRRRRSTRAAASSGSPTDPATFPFAMPDEVSRSRCLLAGRCSDVLAALPRSPLRQRPRRLRRLTAPPHPDDDGALVAARLLHGRARGRESSSTRPSSARTATSPDVRVVRAPGSPSSLRSRRSRSGTRSSSRPRSRAIRWRCASRSRPPLGTVGKARYEPAYDIALGVRAGRPVARGRAGSSRAASSSRIARCPRTSGLPCRPAARSSRVAPGGDETLLVKIPASASPDGST